MGLFTLSKFRQNLVRRPLKLSNIRPKLKTIRLPKGMEDGNEDLSGEDGNEGLRREDGNEELRGEN